MRASVSRSGNDPPSELSLPPSNGATTWRRSHPSGRGICVIDRRGDLCDDVCRSVGPERVQDVIRLDFTDFEWPIGLNFLENTGGQPAETTYIVNGMISIFHRLYPHMHEAMGPMFELYMRNALIAIIDNARQPGTLLDVVRLFEDTSFRSRILDGCRNAQTVDFWHKQAEKSGGSAHCVGAASEKAAELAAFWADRRLLAPQPRVVHPYPEQRFDAITRERSRMR